MDTQIKQEKELILKRVPPGDRWVFADGGKNIYPSLTDALEAWFQQNGDTNFILKHVRVQWKLLEKKKLKFH